MRSPLEKVTEGQSSDDFTMSLWLSSSIGYNGKVFVQGGLGSTTVSTRTKANRKHKISI
ncbi:hypothetical protein [Thermoflexibacter ruber]|uniref:hypothetical protein n=1 Tax=Thermoflexibacter ruber TaxID=1003 RepID=UPI0015A513CF|nr:hypothetical protein [Thermoflexibacter ruber]